MQDKRLRALDHLARLGENPATRPFLVTLYEQQMEFVRFHNGLVWQVSSIFVPVTLVGLSIDFRTETQLHFVGGASIFLILLWAFLTEWHRWMWVHSYLVATKIEEIMGARESAPELPRLITSWRPPNLVGIEPPSWIGGRSIDWGRIIRLAYLPFVVAFWLLRFSAGIDEP